MQEEQYIEMQLWLKELYIANKNIYSSKQKRAVASALIWGAIKGGEKKMSQLAPRF